MPTFEDLIAKVTEMRTAQKAYYKDRQGVDLTKSKQLEKEVDAMLAKLQKSPPLPTLTGQLSMEL